MENSISIEKLHKKADVAALCEAFGKFGRILSASIEYDKNKESLGKAEIMFDDCLSALKSIESMNGKKIFNKAVSVSLLADCQKFNKIFVKNLNKDWDEAEVFRFFSEIGPVVNVQLSIDSGESNGYGKVQFKTCNDAEKAVKYFHNRAVDGQILFVERYKPASERLKLKQNSIEYAEKLLANSTEKNNLHVKNLPRDMNEYNLRDLFEKFGPITSLKIVYDDEGRSRGFGFVCFESMESAARAQKKIDGFILDDKRLEVNFKQDGYARQHYLSLKNKDLELKTKSYKKRSKSTSALHFHPHPLKNTLMKI